MNFASHAHWGAGVALLTGVVLAATLPSFDRPDESAVPVVTPPAPPQLVTRDLSPITPCPALDLDGDGKPEQLEEVPDSCGTGGCQFEVFLHDRSVGVIEGHCPIEIEPRAGGPADIIATWRLGAKETVVTRYWYRDGAYRERSNSTCTGDACTAEHWIVRPAD